MALPVVARWKMAPMLGLTGVVALAFDRSQPASYRSGRDKTYLTERPPAGTGVLRLPGSEAITPGTRLGILPYRNRSAEHRLFPAAQHRKEWQRAWEVVRPFRL